jgi:transposase
VNVNDVVLLQCSLTNLTKVTRNIGIDLTGSICNGDAGFDSKKNRKAIWNRGMKPNIPENTRRRNTAKPKRGRPRHFHKKSYDKRFAVERMFGWEDAYRSLVVRYDRKQANYRGRKHLAYALINLRYFIK